jgi:hypothetical protein
LSHLERIQRNWSVLAGVLSWCHRLLVYSLLIYSLSNTPRLTACSRLPVLVYYSCTARGVAGADQRRGGLSEAAPRVIDMGTVPSDYFTAHHHSSGMNVFLTDFMLFNEGYVRFHENRGITDDSVCTSGTTFTRPLLILHRPIMGEGGIMDQHWS